MAEAQVFAPAHDILFAWVNNHQKLLCPVRFSLVNQAKYQPSQFTLLRPKFSAMHDNPDEAEAYVLCNDIPTIVKHLELVTGQLQDGSEPDGSFIFFENEAVKVTISDSEDGFTCVWVRGCPQWKSSPALARFLAKYLGCIVRCDPADAYPEVCPLTNIFLEFENGKETLFPWGPE